MLGKTRRVVLRRTSHCSRFLSVKTGTNSVSPPAAGSSAKRASIEPLLEEAIGFDKCLQRAASVLVNISERNMMKVLHVHCGGRLGYYLGNSTVFDITGVSASSKDVEAASLQRQYNETKLVDSEYHQINEQFRNASFQAVVCLHAQDALSSSSPSIQQILRLLADNGFALVGAPEHAWEADGLMEQVQTAEAGGGGDLAHSASLLSMQLIDLGGGGDKYMMALLRKGLKRMI